MGTVLEPRTLNLLSSGRCLCFLKPRGVNPDHCFKNNFGNLSRTYHNPPQTICMMSVSWPTVERTSCIESPNTYKGACGDPGSARKAKCTFRRIYRPARQRHSTGVISFFAKDMFLKSSMVIKFL